MKSGYSIRLASFLVLSLLVLTSCDPKKRVQKYSYLTKPEPAKEAPKNEVPRTETENLTSYARIDKVIGEARSYLGTPYRYGGVNRNGIDCSALTQNAWSVAGVSLYRSSIEQSRQGTRVERNDIRKGDIICFDAKLTGKVDHVGMAADITTSNVIFIHATTCCGVRQDSLWNGYWDKRYVMARRVSDISMPVGQK